MKAFLMHANRDFAVEHELPANEAALTQDLELNTLFTAMAGNDPFLFEVARRALLVSLHDPDAIDYRQQILTDCLNNASIVRELYALAGEAIKAERSIWGGFYRDSPRSGLHTAVQKMELLASSLKQLSEIANGQSHGFRSPGFIRFFAMLAEELDEHYLELVDTYLKELKFRSGMLLSAQLTSGNKGKNYTLRRQPQQRWLGRVLDRSGYSFTIPDRDESGFSALGKLEDKGTNLVANALTQSVDHVLNFFVMLRTEIGFYLACLNLSERLAAKGEPTSLPVALPGGQVALRARGLYDACLTVTVEQRIVGNDVAADGKSLVMITGANQGGKSTFLRSVGLAQLMMQCGMFVAADAFCANVCDGILTHYKREEDDAMESGKLDEELARMSQIADHLAPNCMLLCNESFASTNEREGSEIARQIMHPLLKEGVKVLFVTHMFDLAHSFYLSESDDLLFLRAERNDDGARTYKLREGEPLPTSFGADTYQRIFGNGLDGHVAHRSQPGDLVTPPPGNNGRPEVRDDTERAAQNAGLVDASRGRSQS